MLISQIYQFLVKYRMTSVKIIELQLQTLNKMC